MHFTTVFASIMVAAAPAAVLAVPTSSRLVVTSAPHASASVAASHAPVPSQNSTSGGDDFSTDPDPAVQLADHYGRLLNGSHSLIMNVVDKLNEKETATVMPTSKQATAAPSASVTQHSTASVHPTIIPTTSAKAEVNAVIHSTSMKAVVPTTSLKAQVSTSSHNVAGGITTSHPASVAASVHPSVMATSAHA